MDGLDVLDGHDLWLHCIASLDVGLSLAHRWRSFPMFTADTRRRLRMVIVHCLERKVAATTLCLHDASIAQDTPV
jgi:hypothetical protein